MVRIPLAAVGSFDLKGKIPAVSGISMTLSSDSAYILESMFFRSLTEHAPWGTVSYCNGPEKERQTFRS